MPRNRGDKAPAARLKLVVRRLPPTLPADVFWKAVAPYVEGKAQWTRYVPGRPGDAYGQHPVHSRAYALMADVDSLVAFHTGFDGHLFRSKAGDEYQAVVEFAPVEKTPFKTKPKKDERQGTIEKDPDYVSFLESLEARANEPAPVVETSTPAAQPTTTPLLDALRAAASKSKSKSKKKGKDKGEKGEGAKAAALAAISEAASKRAPRDKTGGVIMVAGKGREVLIAPADDTSADSKRSGAGAGSANANGKEGKEGKDKKKKPKGKKKEPGEAGAAAAGEGEAAEGEKKDGEKKSRARGNRGRNRKDGEGGGAADAAGAGAGAPAAGAAGAGAEGSAPKPRKERPPREEKSGGGGGGGGGGGRNRGRGRGGGGGGGDGGASAGGGGIAASEARIDM
ncbi:hypothetical protein Q8F55_007796 [Vanrija albida]|uniref:UPF3 domain-containing protein n=1 Tax=Vanrija albida TaxID=181172 RepID=A0ABR3PVK6_9TREE